MRIPITSPVRKGFDTCAAVGCNAEPAGEITAGDRTLAYCGKHIIAYDNGNQTLEQVWTKFDGDHKAAIIANNWPTSYDELGEFFALITKKVSGFHEP